MSKKQEEISAENFAEAVQSGRLPIDHCIDVREMEEWEVDHLDGAQHVPMNDIPERIDQWNPEKEYYILCAHGVRSLHVQHYMIQRGFERVINIEGGLAKVRLYLDEV